MENMLLGTGLACLIAAVIGGGLRAFGIEIPVFTSIARQLALGVLGVVLIAVASRSSAPSVPRDERVQPPKPIEQQQTGPISLSVNTDPRTVSPGGSTAIGVLATASDGTPVANAQVTIAAGGGVFETTGALKVVGQTDDQGVFRTRWRTYEATAYTGDMSYRFNVEAAKEGMSAGNGQADVFVRK